MTPRVNKKAGGPGSPASPASPRTAARAAGKPVRAGPPPLHERILEELCNINNEADLEEFVANSTMILSASQKCRVKGVWHARRLRDIVRDLSPAFARTRDLPRHQTSDAAANVCAHYFATMLPHVNTRLDKRRSTNKLFASAVLSSLQNLLAVKQLPAYLRYEFQTAFDQLQCYRCGDRDRKHINAANKRSKNGRPASAAVVPTTPKRRHATSRLNDRVPRTAVASPPYAAGTKAMRRSASVDDASFDITATASGNDSDSGVSDDLVYDERDLEDDRHEVGDAAADDSNLGMPYYTIAAAQVGYRRVPVTDFPDLDATTYGPYYVDGSAAEFPSTVERPQITTFLSFAESYPPRQPFFSEDFPGLEVHGDVADPMTA